VKPALSKIPRAEELRMPDAQQVITGLFLLIFETLEAKRSKGMFFDAFKCPLLYSEGVRTSMICAP
ncbi:MAG: hypothetical protein RL263_644, partial [Bacteroidota bacterium]